MGILGNYPKTALLDYLLTSFSISGIQMDETSRLGCWLHPSSRPCELPPYIFCVSSCSRSAESWPFSSLYDGLRTHAGPSAILCPCPRIRTASGLPVSPMLFLPHWQGILYKQCAALCRSLSSLVGTRIFKTRHTFRSTLTGRWTES
jgi:hypothetical protein